MGRGRHRGRLAEGPDAAAGPVLQRGVAEGDRRLAQAKLPRAFWAWDEIIEANKNGFWPYTPATNLLYGLSEACDMLLEEGMQNVFARHQRHAEATRQCVRAWGLEILCQNPA
jgi:alanine-glyoxylate transaminase/serine-glyoxylate transaminase/serine-pyruvate transaminase